ncbi:unnamed protein product [Psylliodes chrysocephalus]|uniref:Fibrinogen C-terminal domain-containing protein n=1 Tax=Psylliodes chrysocephalus TaxID=3402493 RepID=A0A9P0GCT6_9CUCU|nr:unnamed protein product [Psylliodes chrysocephala]
MIVARLLYFISILLSCSFGAVTNNNEKNASCADGPLGISITKESLNIQIGGKKWDHNLNEFIESSIQEAIESNPENKPDIVEPTPEIDPPETDVKNVTLEETDPKHIIKQLETISSELQNIRNVCQQSECVSASSVGNLNNGDICNRIVGISKPQLCDASEDNTGANKNIPRNCKEVQERGQTITGIYEIQPNSTLKPIFVLCDMETRDGGWTVIQKRFDGSEDFDRNWRDYKFGFGNLKRELWIGLENMYQITAFEASELLIEITDRDQIKAFAHYKGFGIGSEPEGYVLNVLNGFSGDAGDSLTEHHFKNKFTTKDLDQDKHPNNCAVLFSSGWWFNNCHVANLNGKYLNIQAPVAFTGLHWRDFRGQPYSHAGSRMLVRPVRP